MKTEKRKNIVKEELEEVQVPEKIDLKAAHRKVMMVMFGIFVAMLLLMLFLSEHVEFASTGGM
ncbi:MAG: hypothetical protein KKB51_22430 [Candidatus Riflebacteria bacterium]|nr:hypothetical protein [Candidatus Riflebacteria bacterium]